MTLLSTLFQGNWKPIQPETPARPAVTTNADGTFDDAVLDYLIEAGIQAPSGDNAQPWVFQKEGNQIALYLVREKDLSFFNFQQIASTIACGAALENIKIAASTLALKATIEYTAGTSPEEPTALIHLEPANIQADPLAEAIWKRQTNRKPYKKAQVSNAVLEQAAASLENADAQLQFVTDREKLKRLAKLIYKIDQIRTEKRSLHEHLMQMTRFTEKEVYTTRDGLPLKNLEAGRAGEVFLSLTKSWSAMKLANRLGLGRIVALHSRDGMMNSSGAALLTVNGRSGQSFLRGGAELERVWLSLTASGLAVQPMTAITLFYLRLLIEGREKFSSRHQQFLLDCQQEYETLFPGVHTEERGQVMLFRFGYAEDLRFRTLRKTPAELTTLQIR